MRLKELAIPLQAFAALFLCGGMAWMIFVMAGFNPNPPTAMDMQLRNTQDVSFVSMNSTAAALAVKMVSEFVPTAIALPATQVSTAAVTATLEFVMIPVSGPTLTPVPTSASLLSLLFPPTKTKGSGAVPTLTLPPTLTKVATPIPSSTPIPTITKTSTPIPTVKTPTSTPKPTATDTSKPPTATTEPPTEPPSSTPTEPPTALPTSYP